MNDINWLESRLEFLIENEIDVFEGEANKKITGLSINIVEKKQDTMGCLRDRSCVVEIEFE